MKLTEQHKLLLMSVLQDTLKISDCGDMNWVLCRQERKKLYVDIIKENEEGSNE